MFEYLDKPKSITVITRKFHNRQGHPLSTDTILINGEWFHKTDVDSFVSPAQNAASFLDRQGYVKLAKYNNGGTEQLHEFCRNNNITWQLIECNVATKNDL